VSDLDSFKSDCQQWIAENYPESLNSPGSAVDQVWGGRKATYKNPDSKLWLDRMAEKGWTAPMWPKEYGGGGLSNEENRVLQSELRKAKCRMPLASFGIWMLGPVLLKYGTEEQKKEHLPKIVRGEIRWCQGYSEPGSGSDLASLQTACEDKGDHWLINGSKIWTSYGDKADWMFCLVRTDKSTKHEGISFVLFDMESEGVDVKPIQLISGASIFCQSFFDNLKVPKDNMVGEINKGWTIAKELLQHERSMVAGFGLSEGGLDGNAGAYTMLSIAKEYVGEADGKISDAVARQKVADFEIKNEAFALTMQRSAEEAQTGGSPGAVSSIFKLYGTELNKKRYELMVELMGSQGLGWEGESFKDMETSITRSWLRSKGNSIEGGTSEIQKNIIAQRVLGLPK
jgi:alkylation response protein AidB-like acyl-CoA dehydrogenase